MTLTGWVLGVFLGAGVVAVVLILRAFAKFADWIARQI